MPELIRWPLIDERDEEAVLRVLRSGNLARGPESGKLEREWAERLGIDPARVVTTSTCTHALHLAYIGAGCGRGSKVLAPAMTFRGTTDPILFTGATPVFCDIEPAYWSIDPAEVERLADSDTRAVAAVHLHGTIGMIEDVSQVCRDKGMALVEDACQAHGAMTTRKAGCFGTWSAFSLNQVKPLQGGQGGLLIGPDRFSVEAIRKVAKVRSYFITEMAAALARSQLGRLHENLDRAESVMERLAAEFGDASQSFRLPSSRPGRWSTTWHKVRIAVHSDEGSRKAMRNRAMELLTHNNVEVSLWQSGLLPDMPAYREGEPPSEGFPVSRELAEGSFILGSEEFPFAAQQPELAAFYAQAFREVAKDLRCQSQST